MSGPVLLGLGGLRVVAKALPQGEIVKEIDERVAVVHLTWTREPERPPCPRTDVFTSADALQRDLETCACEPSASVDGAPLHGGDARIA